MPYELKCDGDSCFVHKKGDPNPKNKKAMTREAAKKYMAALYVNTEGGKKDISDLEYAVIEEKCYSDNYAPYVDKLSQEQANYRPLGMSGERACATCRWFNVGQDSCYVVAGPIVPTGLSDMYMPVPPPWKPEPMQVVIVDQTESAGASLDSKAVGATAEQGAGVLKQVADKIRQVAQSFGMSSAGKSIDLSDIDLEADTGFKVRPDGRWVGWWTNNAIDRTGEQFTLKAIDDFVARVDSKAVPFPELWHKHLHIPMGRADAMARIGYLGFATGTFYDTPTGESGRKAYEKDQEAGIAKKMSHQFLYPKSMKRNGVIHAFNSFELSVLDAGEEANSITKFGVKAVMKVVLDAKKRAELLDKFGGDNEYVDKLLNFADVTSKAMEAAGLDLKSLEALPELMDFEVQDKVAQQEIQELGEATLTGMKAITAQITDLASKIEAVSEAQSSGIANAEKAVADLKAFVDKEFGYTPRASKSQVTNVPANDAQVKHLKTKNAAAGKKSESADTPEVAENGSKSIFQEIISAANNGNKR